MTINKNLRFDSSRLGSILQLWRPENNNNNNNKHPINENESEVYDDTKKEEIESKNEEQDQQQHHQQSNILQQYPTSMALLFILTMEALLVTIMESFIIYYHSMIFAQCEFSLSTLGLGQADLIYHGIFIITPIYQLFLYLDTLRQRNIFQLFTLLLFGILMVIFSGIQTIQHMIFEQTGCSLSYHQISNYSSTTTTFPNSTTAAAKSKSSSIQMLAVINATAPNFQDNVDAGVSNIRPFEYSVLGVVAVSFIILLGCSVKLYTMFKWKNYLSHTFSDVRLRNTLISWAIFTGLLKIDFFFLFAYAIQLVPSVLIGYTNIPAFECLIVFAFSLVTFLLAIYSVRNENIRTLMVFNIIVLGSIGYFGYRLFTFGIPRTAASDPFMLTRYNLLFTTLTLTLLMIITLCTSLVCVRHVFYNKVRILERFHCVCPTCYMHSALMPPGTAATSPTTCSSAAGSSSSMKKANSTRKMSIESQKYSDCITHME